MTTGPSACLHPAAEAVVTLDEVLVAYVCPDCLVDLPSNWRCTSCRWARFGPGDDGTYFYGAVERCSDHAARVVAP